MDKKTLEILKDNGIKITHNRALILSFLLKNVGHYSTKDIYDNVKKSYLNLNLASVYNTLTIFEKKGLIRLVTKIDNQAIWDSNVSTHAHFVCKVCHRVFDINKEFDIDTNVKVGKVDWVKITYFGICNDCFAKMKKDEEK